MGSAYCWNFSCYGILTLGMFIIPHLVHDQFILHLFIIVFFYVILSTSFSFFNQIGLLTLGQAAFMGIGAYTSTLLVTRLSVPFLLALPASGLMALFVSLILGKIVLRAKGVYFVLITFAFTEIIRLVFVNNVSLFGGANGISNIPAPVIPFFVSGGFITANTKSSYYYLSLVVMITTLLVLSKLNKSSIGDVFRIVKESELLARSIGVNTSKYKLLGFMIASFFAGIVGCLYAHYFRYISPHAFTFWESVYVVMICVIGGFKNLRGAVIGSATFVILTEVVRAGKEYQSILFGVIIIVMVIFCPGGLDGLFTKIIRKRGTSVTKSEKKHAIHSVGLE
jgi:branched-chain amino acid transport system permease protein